MNVNSVYERIEMNNRTIQDYLKQLTVSNLPVYRKSSILSKIGTLNMENRDLELFVK